MTRGNQESQFRGMLAVENMMENDYDACAQIIQCKLFEVLRIVHPVLFLIANCGCRLASRRTHKGVLVLCCA